MTPPSISVIIAAYTEARWNDLLDAVASLRQQTLLPREIIIVVDHNPALFARVRAHIPNVIVIENAALQGLSGARNTGIARATSEWVAFLDDDATAAPDWLERMSAHCYAPDVLGVGGATDPWWLDARPHWFPEEFLWVVGCSYRGLPETTTPVRNLFGGNMLIRRALFDAVGGFQTGIGRDRHLLKGCEETEFCIRANQAMPRGVFLYEPRARILHRVPATRTRWNYFLTRCYSEGLSKAQVARLRGARAGLGAERAYTLHVLPRAIARNVMQTFAQHDGAGILRASAIVVGWTATVFGFLVGTLGK
jgi:GT2 family glycosyltransferase